MAGSSGDVTDFSAFPIDGISEEQIDELVRNLRGIMHDPSVNSIVRFFEFFSGWFEKYIHLDSYDKEGAFFYGFRVGGECIQYLFSNYRTKGNQKREETE